MDTGEWYLSRGNHPEVFFSVMIQIVPEFWQLP